MLLYVAIYVSVLGFFRVDEPWHLQLNEFAMAAASNMAMNTVEHAPIKIGL